MLISAGTVLERVIKTLEEEEQRMRECKKRKVVEVAGQDTTDGTRRSGGADGDCNVTKRGVVDCRLPGCGGATHSKALGEWVNRQRRAKRE